MIDIGLCVFVTSYWYKLCIKFGLSYISGVAKNGVQGLNFEATSG